jgi:hypothetical protein
VIFVEPGLPFQKPVEVGIVDLDRSGEIRALEDEEGRRCFILFQCRCNNTRAIPWDESSEELKRRALKAQE